MEHLAKLVDNRLFVVGQVLQKKYNLHMPFLSKNTYCHNTTRVCIITLVFMNKKINKFRIFFVFIQNESVLIDSHNGLRFHEFFNNFIMMFI